MRKQIEKLGPPGTTKFCNRVLEGQTTINDVDDISMKKNYRTSKNHNYTKNKKIRKSPQNIIFPNIIVYIDDDEDYNII